MKVFKQVTDYSTNGEIIIMMNATEHRDLIEFLLACCEHNDVFVRKEAKKLLKKID